MHKAEDKAEADGTVAPKERQRLHHMQDKTSQNIKTQKHHAQVAPKS